MKLNITYIDGPSSVLGELPCTLNLLRSFAAPDRPDYWLGRLERNVRWSDGDRQRDIEHLIVGARLMGTEIRPGVEDLWIGIAFVVDASQVDDAELHFEKCHYVAIGMASVAGE